MWKLHTKNSRVKKNKQFVNLVRVKHRQSWGLILQGWVISLTQYTGLGF